MTRLRTATPCPTCAASTTDGMIAYHRRDFYHAPRMAGNFQWYRREDEPGAVYIACPDCVKKNVPEGYTAMTVEEVREWLRQQ